jgi:hypothetical protein
MDEAMGKRRRKNETDNSAEGNNVGGGKLDR